MGAVKQALIEQGNARLDLAQALSDADSAIETLLRIGFLSARERDELEGYQAAILVMYGTLDYEHCSLCGGPRRKGYDGAHGFGACYDPGLPGGDLD